MDTALASVAFGVLAVGLVVPAVLEFLIGGPPDAGEERAWVANNRGRIAAIDEFLVIMAVVTAIGVVAAWRVMAPVPTGVAIAAVLTLVSVAVAVTVSVLHGRLVYPIRSLDVSADAAALALIVSAFYSALHVIALVQGAALVALGVGLWVSPAGVPFAIATLVLGVACVPLSFAYRLDRRIGLGIMVAAGAWSAWFAAVLATW
ncbi:hypothetical protein [uncultured Demequina sp.]|uniref:hypothetical protein n=1 Tax=uncultured Demequina sp. TaxID=693499 RepID=UPI0025D206C3|nr:hypothetical protein [uncultured Demequina sp.]